VAKGGELRQGNLGRVCRRIKRGEKHYSSIFNNTHLEDKKNEKGKKGEKGQKEWERRKTHSRIEKEKSLPLE